MLKYKILHIVAFVLLILVCISCETGPDVGLYQFGWTTDDGYRYLEIYRPDSSLIDTTHIAGAAFLEADAHNLWCLDSAELRMAHEGDSSTEYRNIYPLYVHRPSGRTDTLFLSHLWHACCLGFGHVHRERFLDKWIILECRLPGRILGYNHLFDETDKDTPLDNLSEGSYDYEGQRLIFESKDFDFWVINRMTTDLYGPLNEKELLAQLKALEIPLPVELKSSYFPYKRHRIKGTGDIVHFPDSMYTRYLFWRVWPHGKGVEPKIIGNK